MKNKFFITQSLILLILFAYEIFPFSQSDISLTEKMQTFELRDSLVLQKNSLEKENNNIKIFYNGNIYINADQKVNNLLVVNGKVEDYNVKISDFPFAELINLNGNAAYPGFNDSHVHLLETSPFFMLGINMTQCSNSQAMADSIKKKVPSLKEGDPVIGLGVSLDDYDKWSLDDLKNVDDAADNHIVFIGDKLGHNIIVNSVTMQTFNITPNIKIPMGGKIGVKDGKLTGMFRESAMTLIGNKFFTTIDKNLIKMTSLNMFNYWASNGYTGVVDLMGSAAGRMMYPEIAMELEAEGNLPIRVHYCYTFFDLNEIADAIKYKSMNTEMVRFVGCKLFVDGAYAAGQAWTTWKNKQNNNGLFYVYPTDSFGIEYNLNRIVDKLETNGLNCHYHIQGDQGIENLLNAFDSVVLKKGKLDCTHTIIHSAFISPHQMQRIKNFNGKVVLTMQPGFWEVEDNLEYYYGDFSTTAYPVKDIIDAGITVGMSTDFTVSPIGYTPATKVIGVATTGGGKPEHHKPLTIRDMIHGFSYGSNATTPSKDLGKLEKGFKADMVVYNEDLYSVPPDKFTAKYPKVKSIWINGKSTFIDKTPEVIPQNFELYQNYPNPFNASTTIKWSSPISGQTSLVLYDILGKKVKTILDEFRQAGNYRIILNENDLASGIYLYKLKVNDNIKVKKMILMK